MVEGIPSIKFSNGTCKGCVVGKHAEFNYEKGKLMYCNYGIYSDVYYHCMLLYLHWRCVLTLYGMSKLCLDLEFQPPL